MSRRRRRALLTSTLGIGAVALVAMTALATLWIDHKRELEPDVAANDTPAVLDPHRTPPAYPPPLPPELTKHDIDVTGTRVAGGLAMLPPPRLDTPPPPVVVTPKEDPKPPIPVRIKGKMRARHDGERIFK